MTHYQDVSNLKKILLFVAGTVAYKPGQPLEQYKAFDIAFAERKPKVIKKK